VRNADCFVSTCAEGRADQVSDVAAGVDDELDAWRLAMTSIARLQSVTPEVKEAFVGVWVERKMLPLSVGNRRVLADALRILLPCGYSGSPLVLYRGACEGERRRRLYGFSWTTEVGVARKFTEHWAQAQAMADASLKLDGGVILKTTAAAEAVLLIREPCDYYDEGEVVVDPFRLGRVELVERLRSKEESEA
jgi:hypothetical protein